MNLLEEYNKREDIIKKRLEDFSKVPKEDYFYEACFCILTPQSSAKSCWKAILLLKENDFENKNINPVEYLSDRIRFHINKSKYLLEFKQKWPLVKEKLEEIKDSRELREYLIKNVKGYGYKEASHFLRNIGHRNVAILDRHILKNLNKLNVIDEIPNTLTPKKYFEIENKFIEFSNKVDISMDELDLLFWSQETGEVFK
ncbi:MAG: N-glycosylase/DNA lyase [archaeon GW2011_AR20]|nr:MAG: N-glycosylase/DNA lyase [archaeon GW2011_AR20]MBS3160977.1 N-glycosylase/DNA lyase [Candidatus Woesearchaeota archaeon]